MSVTVTFDPNQEPRPLYEPLTGVVTEPNFAVVDGRPVPHPEGKVVSAPRYTRPKGRTAAATKAVRPRPAKDEESE